MWTGVPGIQSHLCFRSISLLMRTLAGGRGRPTSLGPCHPHRRSAESCWVLALAWPSFGHCGHLRSEPAEDHSLSLCPSDKKRRKKKFTPSRSSATSNSSCMPDVFKMSIQKYLSEKANLQKHTHTHTLIFHLLVYSPNAHNSQS